MRQRIAIKRRQQGSFMTEASLALAVMSLAGYFAMKSDVEANRLSFAGIEGDKMNIVSAAAQKYSQEKFTELQSGQAVSKNGVNLSSGTAAGQTYAPTVANLVSMGYLDSSFSDQASFSNSGNAGNYQIRIQRTPAGCSVTDCDVTGFVYIDRAITTAQGEADGPAIAVMVKKLGASAGFSMLPAPSVVRFLDSTTMANPVATNPAGVVVARFGYGSSGLSQFVRLNDNRDPNLQDKLTVAKEVKAASFVTDVKTIGAACDVGPNAASTNAIAVAAGAVVICTNGTWQSLGAQAAPSDACTPDGKVATSTATGEQLICKNGVYIKSTSLMAKNVLTGRVLVKDGDAVTKPTCDTGGVADRSFTLTQTSVDVTTAPPKQSMYVGTTDLGNSWSVLIRLRTDTGTEVSGNTHSVTAVLNLECRY